MCVSLITEKKFNRFITHKTHYGGGTSISDGIFVITSIIIIIIMIMIKTTVCLNSNGQSIRYGAIRRD